MKKYALKKGQTGFTWPNEPFFNKQYKPEIAYQEDEIPPQELDRFELVSSEVAKEEEPVLLDGDDEKEGDGNG